MKLRFFSALSLVALVLPAALMVACGDDDDDDDDGTSPTSAGAVPGNLTKVNISDNKFTPANLQVPVGSIVTWEWSGSVPHSVKGTFDGKAIQSPTLTGTGEYLEAFQKAGKFEYQCGVHGEAMKGTITIQ